MASFNANDFNRKLRDAQRRAQQEYKREIDRVLTAVEIRSYPAVGCGGPGSGSRVEAKPLALVPLVPGSR